MPNPASKVRWNGNYFFGDVSMFAKPRHAALVAAVIAGWSGTEAHLGRVFANLVSSKHAVTMNMFAAARSFEVQRDLLLAAARTTLPRTHFTTFEASIVVVSRASRDRHAFAHGIWGHSADPELDALLLVQPEHLWDLTRKRMRHRRANWSEPSSDPPNDYFLNMPSLSREVIMVYEIRDLEDARQRIEKAYKIADALFDLSASQAAQERRTILQWLRSQPEIRTAEEKKHSNPQPERASRPRKARS